jgi:hypothetical protein
MIVVGNVVLEAIVVVGVWTVSSAVGAMLGNFAAVAERKSPDVRGDWIAIGGAIGCAVGLPLMLCAVAQYAGG